MYKYNNVSIDNMNHLVHIEINKDLDEKVKMLEKPSVLFLDYDQTLVIPKEGRTFPKDVDDWQWLFPNIPSIITQKYNDGYRIVICTNQTKPWKCTQIENALSSIKGVKMDVCIGMEKSVHKPSTAMIGLLAWFGKEHINVQSSLFVGDALGRKNDYSDSDKVFAQTLGIQYIEPEMFFDMFFDDLNLNTQQSCLTPSQTPEVIIMVGYPGSGKSTLALSLVEEHSTYQYISGDIYKTSTKMISTAKKICKENNDIKPSFIFDATNPTIEKRAEYITFAKVHDYPIRCVYMNTSFEESKRRNMHREDEKKIPAIVYNIYRKKFEEPNEIEGFTLLTL